MKLNYQAISLASSLALVSALATPGLAQSSAEMIKTAEKACIENAAKDGYNPSRSQVVSSRVIDADKVEVVLNLTKDGSGFDRLTCPYSVSKGIGGFLPDGVGDVSVPKPQLGRLWWLLVPIIGLPLLLWALRGRDKAYLEASKPLTGRVYTEGYVNTNGVPLDVHEAPNSTSRVLRSLNNGEHLRLSGRHDHDWVELSEGGWVPNYYLRYTRDLV